VGHFYSVLGDVAPVALPVLFAALIAGVLTYLDLDTVFDEPPRLSWGPWFRLVVRLKFTTLSLNGKAIPIGVDTVYERLKDLINKRINRVIREWRMEQIGRLAQSEMADLRQKAKTLVISDELMNDQQRKTINAWIEQTAVAEGIANDDRRLLIATFIVTGGQTRAIS
jgi:hypothetical protein